MNTSIKKNIQTDKGFTSEILQKSSEIWRGYIKPLIKLLLLIVVVFFVVATAYEIYADSKVPVPSASAVLGYVAAFVFTIFVIVALIFLLKGVNSFLNKQINSNEIPRYKLGYNLFIIYTLLSSIISAYTTWYGFRMVLFAPDEGIFYYHILPLFVAVLVLVFIMKFWMFMVDKIEQYTTKLYMILASLGVCVIFGVSTYTSALGFGANTAMKQHYMMVIESYEDAVSEVVDYRSKDGQILLLINRHASDFADKSQKESETGIISGVKGGGTVTRYLSEVSEGLNADYQSIEESLDNTEQKRAELSLILKSLKERIDLDAYATPLEMEKDVAQVLEVVRTELTKLAKQSPLIGVKSRLSVMSAYNFEGAYSSSSEVRKKQEYAIQKMMQFRNQVVQNLEKVLVPLLDAPQPEIPKYERIKPTMSVITHYQSVFLSWMIAICCDFGSLIFVIFVSIVGLSQAKMPEESRKTSH